MSRAYARVVEAQEIDKEIGGIVWHTFTSPEDLEARLADPHKLLVKRALLAAATCGLGQVLRIGWTPANGFLCAVEAMKGKHELGRVYLVGWSAKGPVPAIESNGGFIVVAVDIERMGRA